jgi:flagellar biosynthesis protein
MSGSEPPPQRRPRAAALRYDRDAGGAPRVVAAGAGEIAARIVDLARAAGVPVHEEPALAEALARLEVDADIPPELYAAVAEVLVWAYGLDAPLPNRESQSGDSRPNFGPERQRGPNLP